MKVNFKMFRIFKKYFNVLKVVDREQYQFQKILVKELESKNAIPFEMALPFRIQEPKRNFQIIEDGSGRMLTKEESDTLIKEDKLNVF